MTHRTSSGSRAGSKPRDESTEQRGIAERKKVDWINRSPVTRTSETESPPLTSFQPIKANTHKDTNEVTELTKIIECQNAQIKEQNAQIRAIISKIETLVSNGSSANTKPQNNTTAVNNAGGLSKVPRRDPLDPPRV
ncbi:hypothetical protein MRX96_047092 [Rhipicephalus microplus]